ncbi:hypothetical protein MKW94_005722 [Papaver nudicaule]|uniref:3'-5' exonuclease domain-containing protein n=1 Tax=Papaver nudicaule TaxID=74823 RepID=A0AA41VC57_PAPNU|nr:hypothetical protein [Papaver nudicaule]
MAGESSVQNGLAGLCGNDFKTVSGNGAKKTWGDQMSSKSSRSNGAKAANSGDQMSSKSSTSNGGRVRGGDNKNTRIQVVDKSMSTHHTYNVYFYNEKIETTVTHTSSVVDDWIQDVYDDFPHTAPVVDPTIQDLYEDFPERFDNLIVGLDIEWRRMRNPSTQNRVAVLQLCVPGRCLIFQLSCCDGIPESLDVFLGNKKVMFVGVGIQSHAHKLLFDSNSEVVRFVELGSLAAYKLTDGSVRDCRDSHFHRAGLKKLAKDVLNQELPEKRYIQWSNWEREFLSDEQVVYACLDAFVSFKLGDDLMSRANPRNNNRQPRNNRQQKKYPSGPKKVEEGKTKQRVPLKSNGGNKTNGTNSTNEVRFQEL